MLFDRVVSGVEVARIQEIHSIETTGRIRMSLIVSHRMSRDMDRTPNHRLDRTIFQPQTLLDTPLGLELRLVRPLSPLFVVCIGDEGFDRQVILELFLIGHDGYETEGDESSANDVVGDQNKRKPTCLWMGYRLYRAQPVMKVDDSRGQTKEGHVSRFRVE